MTAIDFPNSPSTNDTFTAGGVTWRYDGSKWGLDGYASGPTYETALPGSPVDGQEVYYAADATNGVIWHLRYRSGGGTYKWEFVGGSPLYKADNDVRSVTSGTFTDIPTDTIVQAVPLAGEYLVQHGANMEINPGNRTALYGYAITDANDANATNPDDRQCTILGQPVSSGAILASYNQMANVRTITTAGYKFRERAKSTFVTDTLTVYARRLVVTPIRVG